jgi:hypothetical protein
MHYFTHCNIDSKGDSEREPMNHVTALYDGQKLQGMPADDHARALWHAADWAITYSRKGRV